MEKFSCQIRVINMPVSVLPGRTYQIETQVDILQPNMTLGFVMLQIPATGELLRFAKKSTDRYLLTYDVPDYVQPGTYPVTIYATDERGMQSAQQQFMVTVLRS